MVEKKRLAARKENTKYMKILSVYNIKGGLGRTTLSVNLAYLSAAEGNASLKKNVWQREKKIQNT